MTNVLTSGRVWTDWAHTQSEKTAVMEAKTNQRRPGRLARRSQHAGTRAKNVVAYLTPDRLWVGTLRFAGGQPGAVRCPRNPHPTPRDGEPRMGHAPAARRFDRDLTERLESLRSALPTLKPWFACASDREMDEAFGSPAEHMEGAELLYQRPFTSLGTPWEACLIHSYSFFPLGGVGATLAAIEAGAGMVLTASWDGWMDAL